MPTVSGRLERALEAQEERKRLRGAEEEEKRIRAAYVDFLTTDAGRIVLADLRGMYYDVALFSPDPIVMAGAVANHDLVARILTVLKEAEERKDPQPDAET